MRGARVLSLSPETGQRQEAMWIARLRTGDQGAFDAIFRANYAALVAFADGILRDHDAAEEVVQDVMVELWRRRDSLVIESTLRAYLHRAVRNRALNHIRHVRVVRAASPAIAERTAEPTPADARAIQSEMQIALARAVESLPPRCREVFELSRERGLSYAEIADTMEISVKTVEAQMGKALRILREQLAAWLPGPRESTPADS